MNLDFEALQDIIDDMMDIETDSIRKDNGKKTKGLSSSKKKPSKKDGGFALMIEISNPTKKSSHKDDDIINKILGHKK